ncbi:myosin heavy chain kinase B [Ischnura elegans]|uniref:myosin heavy chain kinase B n=1 Tax=Ischnura elegans TaxID=197161 RepID=UPI001ED86D8D|nr:myosin heavy chain kinase B [Ischnura elegans]
MSFTLNASAARPHDGDVVSLCWAPGRGVFSGGEDGIVKVWDEKLSLIGSVPAGSYSVYDIVYHNDSLYTCSYDGKISIWSPPKSGDTEWAAKAVLEGHMEGVRRMRFSGDVLYSGDEQGVVIEWINDEKKRIFNILEEIWDLWVIDTTMYTVRDKDISITEIKAKNTFSSKGTLEGRGPMCLIDDHIYCITRDGMGIMGYGKADDKYPKLDTLTGHERIINALTGKNHMLFSAGWDGKVKAWDIRTMKCTATYDAKENINCLTVTDNMTLYAGGSNGVFIGLQFN